MTAPKEMSTPLEDMLTTLGDVVAEFDYYTDRTDVPSGLSTLLTVLSHQYYTLRNPLPCGSAARVAAACYPCLPRPDQP